MKESEAYKQAIRCVIYVYKEIGMSEEDEIETLKILFRDLHYAEKREMPDGKL